MKVKLLVSIGVYEKDEEVEMELGRAQRYVDGGLAVALMPAPPVKEEDESKPEVNKEAPKEPKPKPKKEAKQKVKAVPKAEPKAEEKE